MDLPPRAAGAPLPERPGPGPGDGGGAGGGRPFVAINNRVSQSVPHVHIHIVPRRKGDGLRGFFWPRQRYRSAAEMPAVQEALREAVERLRVEGSAAPQR